MGSSKPRGYDKAYTARVQVVYKYSQYRGINSMTSTTTASLVENIQIVRVVYASEPSDYVVEFEVILMLTSSRSGLSVRDRVVINFGQYVPGSVYTPADQWDRDSINNLIKFTDQYKSVRDQLEQKLGLLEVRVGSA